MKNKQALLILVIGFSLSNACRGNYLSDRWLILQNYLSSQSDKNHALYKAITVADLDKIKFWLSHGAQLTSCYNDHAMFSLKDKTCLRLPVILYLFGPLNKPADLDQMLEVLKPFGVRRICWQLKSGFNQIKLF